MSKIRVTITTYVETSDYSEDLSKSDNVKELVNMMLDGEADLPEKREIHVEYL